MKTGFKSKLALLSVAVLMLALLSISRLISQDRLLAKKEASAIARVQALGGWVERHTPQTRMPTWLPSFIASFEKNEYVYGVVLRGSMAETKEYENHQLLVLQEFKDLKILDAGDSDISDDDLMSLISVRSLTGINLENTGISGEALEKFKKHRPDVAIDPPNPTPIVDWPFSE